MLTLHKGSVSGAKCYAWPVPSTDAEQWRYITMQSCQDALRIATSEYDPRTKLRSGLRETLLLAKSKLIEIFEMVTTLNQTQRQALYHFAERAARMWILFGVQRCRLLLIMHNLSVSSNSRRPSEIQELSIEFVLRPEIRRIGDTDGDILDKEHVVKGCEGESTWVFSRS